MKKLIKNEGKIASVIILASLIFSFGIFFASNKAHAIMQAQLTDLAQEPYDGGGGGGGGGGYVPPTEPTTPVAPTTPVTSTTTPTTPTNPTDNLPAGCTSVSTHGVPMACDPKNWPKLGETKSLAWCKNDAKADFKTQCEGTNLNLYRYTPAYTQEENCTYDQTTERDSCQTVEYPAKWEMVQTLTNGCAYSEPNACGEKVLGIRDASLTPPPVSVTGFGTACKSPVNSCGQTTSGSIGCDGTCNAKTAPANPGNFGATCTSPANSCGDTTTGTILCDGSCSAKAAPSAKYQCGSGCNSAANICGMTNAGKIDTNGNCTALKPADSACPSCVESNSCGDKNTGYSVGGVCNAQKPAERANYNKSCTSAANSCGMTTTGTTDCSGTCMATKPAESLCPQPCTSAPNACGQTTSGMTSGGVCQAQTPANPTVYNVTGKCTPPVCTINEQLNLTTYKCDPIVCKSNQILNNGKCEDVICKSNEMLVGNSCLPKPIPVDGKCSTTVVDDCQAGASFDVADTGTQYLWTCKGTSVTYSDNGVSKTDRGADASCSINKIIAKTPTVTVNPPSASFQGSGITTFNWSVQDATECKMYNAGSYVKDIPLSGSYTSGAIVSSTNYEVRCTNILGEAPYPNAKGQHTVSVTAIPPKPPILTVVEQPRGGMSIAFGESNVQRLTIRNDGELALVGRVYLKDDINGTFSFIEKGSDLNFSLNKNATKTFNFKYSPRKLEQLDRVSLNRRANLAALGRIVADSVVVVIESNDGNASVVVDKYIPVNQNGVDAVSGPTSLNVGEVPANTSRTFKYSVKNNTTSGALEACLVIRGNSEFGINDGSVKTAKRYHAQVPQGGNTVFDITFSPKTFVTPYSDSIDVGVTDDNGASCQTVYTATLSGTGVKPVGKFNEI